MGGLCVISRDIKVLIAFSSVAHMGLALALVSLGRPLALWGRLLIFLTHGFSSSLIFLVAYLIYLRTNSRRLILNQGILASAPALRLLFFIRCVALLGGPPASTLLRELIGLSLIAVSWPPGIGLLVLGAFLGGAYRMLMYSRLAHSSSLRGRRSLVELSSLELLVGFYHLAWVLGYFIIFS